MAWCPFAKHHKDITLRSSQRKIKPVGIVFHTAVSNRSNLRPTGDVRWTFYLDEDGTLHQYFDTERSISAHVDGNYFDGKGFLAVECWDGAGTSVWPDYNTDHDGGPAYTAAQRATLVKLLVWLHQVHGIPLKRATGPQGEGVGYHSQFLRSYHPRWTRSHVCPGDKRIAQHNGIIADANKQLSAPKPAPQPEETEVTPEQIEATARRAADLVWFERLDNPLAPEGAVDPHASAYLVSLANKVDELRHEQDDVLDKLNALTAAVNELLARGN